MTDIDIESLDRTGRDLLADIRGRRDKLADEARKLLDRADGATLEGDDLAAFERIESQLDELKREEQGLPADQERREGLYAALDEAAGIQRRAAEVGDLKQHFRRAEQAAYEGQGYRFGFDIATAEIFERSTTTANAGARHEATVGSTGGGIWLPRESGALNDPLPPGTRLEGGVYGANTAVATPAEGAAKPELDPSSLGTSTVSPYAVSATISLQSELAGRGIEQFTWAATRKVRRSVNDAFTTAMVAAAGSARAFATSAVNSVDGAIAFVMAEAAAVPSLIVCADTLFNPLASSGAPDPRNSFPAFRGIRLVPSTLAGLAGNALVIDGGGLTVSLSGIEVRSQPQVKTNSTDVVVEAWFAVLAHGSSSVVLQDATTP